MLESRVLRHHKSMYAIFESGGKQHRAEPGQRLALEKLAAPVGETVVFDRVLLVRDPDSGDCRIGAPYVEGAEVTASVVAQYRDPKVVVFKRKRRKGYRRKQGHRQQRTQVRVDAIRPSSENAGPAPTATDPTATVATVTEEPPPEEARAAETGAAGTGAAETDGGVPGEAKTEPAGETGED